MSSKVGLRRLEPAALDRRTMRADGAPKPITKAEAVARRVATSANRKQPLSVRNRQRLQGGTSSPTKNLPTRDDEGDDWDHDRRGRNLLVIPNLEDDSYDSESSSHSCRSFGFDDVHFDDPFNLVHGASPPQRFNPVRNTSRRNIDVRGVSRPKSRTTNTLLDVQAPRSSKNVAMDQFLKNGTGKVDVWDAHPKMSRHNDESSHRKERKQRETPRPVDREAEVSDLNVSRRNRRESQSRENKSLDSALPKVERRYSCQNVNAASVHNGSTCSRRTSISLDTALKQRKKKVAVAPKGWGDSWGSMVAIDKK